MVTKLPAVLAWAVAYFGLAAGPPTRIGSNSPGRIRVAHTRLEGRACKTVRFDPVGDFSEQRCPGVGGYRLLVVDSDSRMSVTVVAPHGARHPLAFWETVTPHFSALGRTAEWRIERGVPRALVLPLTVNDDPESTVETPYLVVVRLQGEVCVVGKVRGLLSAPAEARRIADTAADLPCLKQ